MARKNGADSRYGICYMDRQRLLLKAAALKLEKQADLGRFKITSVHDGVGARGLFQVMAKLSWELEVVILNFIKMVIQMLVLSTEI